MDREDDPKQCMISGVSKEIIDIALDCFCDAFDIPDSQKYCLRPHDRINDIYEAMTKNQWWDDCELERLNSNVENIVGRKISEAEGKQVNTIEDLIRFINDNKKT